MCQDGLTASELNLNQRWLQDVIYKDRTPELKIQVNHWTRCEHKTKSARSEGRNLNRFIEPQINQFLPQRSQLDWNWFLLWCLDVSGSGSVQTYVIELRWRSLKSSNETWKIERKKITSYLKERKGLEKHQEGLGKPDLCEVDQESEDGQVELVDGLEEPSELSMTVGEGDTGLVFLNGKYIFFPWKPKN